MTNTWSNFQALRARGRKIIRLRAKGKKWAEIGRELGVSRQRAYQLWQEIQAGRGPYGGLL